MVYMNYWNIELYGSSVRDDFDDKMNYFKHIKGLFYVYWLLIEELMHGRLKSLL